MTVGRMDAVLSGLLGLDTGWESHDYNTEGNSTTKTNNNNNKDTKQETVIWMASGEKRCVSYDLKSH